ncbi:unnamed protein product [Parnassius mnemosyne]|uniref:THAP-type domain-containing protein n=1 Tax=Parnassius mnemosyne TaxID=213953 RepID=A0AAV1L369_9NEOP
MPSCCIIQCSARKSKNLPELTIHRFPVNKILKKKWLSVIGTENINPRHKMWYVCSMHFEESCFNRTLDVTRLHDNAVPSSSLIISDKTSRAVLRKKQNKPESSCPMEWDVPDDNLIENAPVKVSELSDMSDNDTDCEIEYLDEDAEIVQQCVQTVEEALDPAPAAPAILKVPLLVERRPVGKPKKKRKAEEDSDYEPSKYSPPRTRKRKGQKILRSTQLKPQKFESPPTHAKLESKEYVPPKVTKPLVQNDELPRSQLDIRIPDYEDPLCLPVRAITKDENDMKKLRTWNNLCLEHLKRSDAALRLETGETHLTKRTVVLRNVNNKQTGKVETTMWSKIQVENKKGDKKSEVVQSVLPKYREKKLLNSYNFIEARRRKPFHHINEVILTKEDHKDGERLIVYKPKETLSLVYKMLETNIDGTEEEKDENDDEQKKFLKEVASCRVCAPCYQMSWRGFRKNDKKIRCQICSRVCLSVYNLLSHLKSHTAEDILKHKKLISMALSKVVDYHYKCRICQQQFPNIKEMRSHVLTHRGTEPFVCDIGSHPAT